MRAGVYQATVERLEAGGTVVWVKVQMPAGHSAGPYRCQFLEGPGAVAAVTGAASAGAAHTHPVAGPAALARGDVVAVAFLHGDPDRPLVLGRIAG